MIGALPTTGNVQGVSITLRYPATVYITPGRREAFTREDCELYR